jgi:hypothetical protein
MTQKAGLPWRNLRQFINYPSHHMANLMTAGGEICKGGFIRRKAG